jgi:hypothetical protein
LTIAKRSTGREGQTRDGRAKRPGEEAGDQVTAAVFFVGLASTLALFLSRNRRPQRAWALSLVVVLGLITSFLYARTAHSGGRISHPELRD